LLTLALNQLSFEDDSLALIIALMMETVSISNVSQLLQDYMAQYSRMLSSSYSLQ
jgi:hypothetical protein